MLAGLCKKRRRWKAKPQTLAISGRPRRKKSELCCCSCRPRELSEPHVTPHYPSRCRCRRDLGLWVPRTERSWQRKRREFVAQLLPGVCSGEEHTVSSCKAPSLSLIPQLQALLRKPWFRPLPALSRLLVFEAPAWVRLYLCFPRSFASALHRSAELHHFRPDPLQDRPALIQYSWHVHCSNRSACHIGNHNVKPLPSHLLGLRTHLTLPDGRLARRPSPQSIGRLRYRSL